VSFHDYPFPLELSSLTPKTTWKTQVTELGGGGEQRAGLFADARRRYNATNPTLTLAQYRQIESHFNARRGQLFSFPLLDRSSFSVSNEGLGTGGGIGSTNQLTLNAGDAGNAYNREIYLPKTGTITVRANTVAKAETTDWTLAYSGSTGGLLTWVTSVSGLTLDWSGQFYVAVRYEIDELPDSKLFLWREDNTGLVEGPDIPLIEVRYPGEFA